MVADANASDPRSALLQDLKAFYRNVVQPAFANSILADLIPFTGQLDSAKEDSAAYPYLEWRNMIDYASLVLHDPNFTVSPELGQSKTLAASEPY